MGATKIEWAESVWNPVTGCTKISAGCLHCYAERMSKRLRGRFGYDKDDPFKVTWHSDKLEQPLKWRKPRKVFVCSMGDLFHEDVKDEWIDAVFWQMIRWFWRDDPLDAWKRAHTFMILTKRPDRMEAYMDRFYATNHEHHPWPNIWLGTSIENQEQAGIRIPQLLSIPAAVHFVSLEPLLGAIRVFGFGSPTWGKLPASTYLNWVIAGAETGPGARPMDLDWARSLRDQCQEAGAPFFFKRDSDGNRELDGVQWNEYPR